MGGTGTSYPRALIVRLDDGVVRVGAIARVAHLAGPVLALDPSKAPLRRADRRSSRIEDLSLALLHVALVIVGLDALSTSVEARARLPTLALAAETRRAVSLVALLAAVAVGAGHASDD